MQNSIKTLTAGLLVLAAISWSVISNKNSPTTQDQLLIPALQSQVNDIDKIIISKNDETINLNKADGTWRILQANNFIADANKVANLLLDLRKFKLKEKKTVNPDKYDKLSLAKSGDNAATIIELYKGKTQVANISIGKQAQKSQGTYVRINDEAQTWLSQGKLEVKFGGNDWIVTTIFDVDISQIKSVTYQSKDKKPFSVNKLSPQDDGFAFVKMPENHQLKSGLDVNSLANGLQKFSIESTIEKNTLTSEPVLMVSYELFSGLQYQLSFYHLEDEYLMNVEFVNLGNANQYEQQLSNWSYVIANYKFDAMNKDLSDVIETITTANDTLE